MLVLFITSSVTLPVWCLFQQSTGIILYPSGWNCGFKNPWRQGLSSLPGGTSVLLSTVWLAHSGHPVNNFWINDWIKTYRPSWFMWVWEEMSGPASGHVCAPCRHHSTGQAYSLDKVPLGFMTTGYSCWVLWDHALSPFVPLLGVVNFTQPHVPVLSVEGKWFLLERMQEQGAGRRTDVCIVCFQYLLPRSPPCPLSDPTPMDFKVTPHRSLVFLSILP